MRFHEMLLTFSHATFYTMVPLLNIFVPWDAVFLGYLEPKDHRNVKILNRCLSIVTKHRAIADDDYWTSFSLTLFQPCIPLFFENFSTARLTADYRKHPTPHPLPPSPGFESGRSITSTFLYSVESRRFRGSIEESFGNSTM